MITFSGEQKMENSTKKHELGTIHSNEKAHKNGLDEIDLWAIGIGKSEKGLNAIRPKRKHIHAA